MTLKKMILIGTLCVCLLMGCVSASEYNSQEQLGDVNVNVSPQINVVNQNNNNVDTNVAPENNINSPKTTNIKKITKIYAPTKIFNIKNNIKKYTVTLTTNNIAVKNKIVVLKVKGQKYKAKTNNQGKATFKLNKLKKKGTYKGTITYNGTKKIVTIKVK